MSSDMLGERFFIDELPNLLNEMHGFG